MKRVKELLEKLTEAFPPNKPARHSVALSDEGSLLVTLVGGGTFYSYVLNDEDCGKDIPVLVAEIGAMHAVRAKGVGP